LINSLSGQVFITSEGWLDDGLAKYEINVSPEKMHDLLYYADLLIGDSQTMTTEAGVLGTPAM
jgi:predicted glycosyltransferase